MNEYTNKHIRRALKLYHYEQVIDITAENEKFYQNYLREVRHYGIKKKQRDFKYFYNNLDAYCHTDHTIAKNLMFQGKTECNKYFARTAFWGLMKQYHSVPAEYIDYYTDYLNYALFVEDKPTIQLGLQMLAKEWQKEDAQTAEYRKQLIYPKTYLLHFLLEKYMGENPILAPLLSNFDHTKRYDIYQPIVLYWEDFSKLPLSYWDELCEYHLNGMALYTADNRDKEEFLLEGIVPMELLNLIKVREKLGLDLPKITHELFTLPTAQLPLTPTGYTPDTDVLFQLIHQTVIAKHPYTLDEIIHLIKEKKGEEATYFM